MVLSVNSDDIYNEKKQAEEINIQMYRLINRTPGSEIKLNPVLKETKNKEID